MKDVVESKDIRKAANSQQCTFQVQGVCNYCESTVVFAHFPSVISGYKSTDFSGGFCCSDCHDWIDRQVNNDSEEREIYMRRSQVATQTILFKMGIIKVKGVA